jgi:hypothetical protein
LSDGDHPLPPTQVDEGLPFAISEEIFLDVLLLNVEAGQVPIVGVVGHQHLVDFFASIERATLRPGKTFLDKWLLGADLLKDFERTPRQYDSAASLRDLQILFEQHGGDAKSRKIQRGRQTDWSCANDRDSSGPPLAVHLLGVTITMDLVVVENRRAPI